METRIENVKNFQICVRMMCKSIHLKSILRLRGISYQFPVFRGKEGDS
jgi:hypothetical protein